MLKEVPADGRGDEKCDDEENESAFPEIGRAFEKWDKEEEQEWRDAVGDVGVKAEREYDAGGYSVPDGASSPGLACVGTEAFEKQIKRPRKEEGRKDCA